MDAMSEDDGYDKDMEQAIKLSLAASQSQSRTKPIVIEDSDDEDITDHQPASLEDRYEEELKRAIEMSKLDAPSVNGNATATVAERTHSSTSVNPSTSSMPATASSTSKASAFLSERAQLEKERLERQKRLRSQGSLPPADEPPLKRPNVNPRTENAKASTNEKGKGVMRIDVGGSVKKEIKQELFLDGELRQTANMHVEASKDKRPIFRLSDVLGKTDDLEFVILSTYCAEISWVYSLFPPNVPVIFISPPDSTGQATIKNILPNWMRTTPFLRNGRGAMHVKLFLLFYKSHLRVAIPTANMIPYDWRDIENTVWLQDFPRLSPSAESPKKKDDFAGVLSRVLVSMNVGPALMSMGSENKALPIRSLSELRTNYDWSKAKALLVPAMHGKYEGWSEVLKNGHTRLMKAVRDISARAGPTRGLLLECQGSSIGTYSTSWLNEFYHSALGSSAEDWLDTPKTRRSKLAFPNIKIVYPSLATVRSSVLGEEGGGTMFCRRSQWSGAKFPKELFHDSNSRRGRVLMHSKMILATFTTPTPSKSKSKKQTKLFIPDPNSSQSDSDSVTEVPTTSPSTPVHGWLYVGSANFTPSAWGTLSGSAFQPILNVTNYELGVVLPLMSEEMAERVSCFERPPRKYTSSDLPWMQDESLVLQQGQQTAAADLDS